MWNYELQTCSIWLSGVFTNHSKKRFVLRGILFLRLEEVSGDIQKIRNETRSRLKEAEMQKERALQKQMVKAEAEMMQNSEIMRQMQSQHNDQVIINWMLFDKNLRIKIFGLKSISVTYFCTHIVW